MLGHLIPGQIPQLSFDLVFDDVFELSHNWKNGSVHFAGYQSVMGDDEYPFTISLVLMFFVYECRNFHMFLEIGSIKCI